MRTINNMHRIYDGGAPVCNRPKPAASLGSGVANQITAFICLALICGKAIAVVAAPPAGSNLRAIQMEGTMLVEILYDVADPDSETVNIHVAVSNDGGVSYLVPAVTFEGDYGPGIRPGTNKRIVWNAGLDWPGYFTSHGRVRVTAQDALPDSNAPPGMAFIPSGGFAMGDPPARSTYVSAFYIDRFEVSLDLWTQVFTWAVANGYSFDNAGQGNGAKHPVHSINWYDAVKWCNARSEKEGRTPVYYIDTTHTDVYRTGQRDLQNAVVKWDAAGYRLPTEAEWEKAARGDLEQHHYPWPSFTGTASGYEAFIDGHMANYQGSQHPFSDLSPPTTPVGYYDGRQEPTGEDVTNGYGLYDMAGNVQEWCWDRSGYLGTDAANDPRGPDSGSTQHVLRGGNYNHSAAGVRCAFRNVLPSRFSGASNGFRSALGQP